MRARLRFRRKQAEDSVGLQLLGFTGSVLLAALITGACMMLFGAVRDVGRDERCSTVTLSTPDGKPCFPRHHDRSRKVER